MVKKNCQKNAGPTKMSKIIAGQKNCDKKFHRVNPILYGEFNN